jgi:hypothetical protein
MPEAPGTCPWTRSLAGPGCASSCRTWTRAVLPSHVSPELDVHHLAVACLSGAGCAPPCRTRHLARPGRAPSCRTRHLARPGHAPSCRRMSLCTWTCAVLPDTSSCQTRTRAVLPSRRLAGPRHEVSPSRFAASS